MLADPDAWRRDIAGENGREGVVQHRRLTRNDVRGACVAVPGRQITNLAASGDVPFASAGLRRVESLDQALIARLRIVSGAPGAPSGSESKL